MDIHTNIPLKNYTTMKLGGAARFMADAKTPEDVARLAANAASQQLPIFVLGGGSNTIARDEGFAGLIIRMLIPGFEIVEDNLNDVVLRVGAGESWDETVARTVDLHLSGIEAMSAIPGTVGAAPVQNVGAYGQETADVLVSLEAYDLQSQQFVVLQNEACGFSYRHSIFRGEQAGRYIITAVTFRLSRTLPQPPFYPALQTYLEAHNQVNFTQKIIRDAIIAIRADKLPDPTIRPNTGSFFKNAIIEPWQLAELKETYPDIPSYDMADGHVKVPTGWLIETAGLKGELLHGMRVHDKNALVLINESATSYADLAAARNTIIGTVRDTFRIQIEQEPLEL